MTNTKKVIGLLVLLAIPIIILVFLELFGQHHYDIPTDPDEAEGLSAEVPPGYLGRDFDLSSLLTGTEAGRQQDGAETALIIYFAPSAALDTAQLIFEELARVQDIFANNPEVRMLTTVSTDDTDSLHTLISRYRSRPSFWQWLANSTENDRRDETLPPNATAATLLLVDQNQKIRGYYDGMQEKEMDRLVAETRILLYDVE